MRCENMKWIRWVLPKIQSRHNSVHRWTRWTGNQYYPLQLRWAGGDKTVLVSTLEYLKVPGQDAFTKSACINTMIYRICYQIFVTYVISNTVWNKVRHPPLTCEICGQGSHNECILHKMNVSEEEIDAFGPQEAAARLNPTRLPGAGVTNAKKLLPKSF